ncbi:MAG: dUTP diphosphatase, partial [Proteobacteria bacterium]|nr:dUTP diphosphatase [Pseudomonadota bacterium]
PGSIGTDLFAPVDMVAVPKNITCIPVDLLLVPSPGYYLRIASKSGLAVKHNLTVEAGVLDPDYRGNVVVVLRNHSEQPHLFRRGEPIAQVIQEKAAQPVLVEAPILDSTIRGTGGFGSTTTG